jgi:hypothetical protein
MALGVAIGAATLLVGTEVAKNLEEKPAGVASFTVQPDLPANSAQELEDAFREYQAARQAYDLAVAARGADLRPPLAALRRAKARLERAITLNTPGLGVLDPRLATPPQASIAPSAPMVHEGPSPSSAAVATGSPDLAAVSPPKLPGPVVPPASPAVASSASGPVAPSRGPGGSAESAWFERFQRDFLLPDAVLMQAEAMSDQAIQTFLERRGGALARLTGEDSPARIIGRVARRHGINPQILLVRLQAAQGLVTRPRVASLTLDWAMGVGSPCHDAGNPALRGFERQLDWVAHTLQKAWVEGQDRLARGESLIVSIDGHPVRVRNAATYALYRECPHFHGNTLFHDLWRAFRKDWETP